MTSRDDKGMPTPRTDSFFAQEPLLDKGRWKMSKKQLAEFELLCQTFRKNMEALERKSHPSSVDAREASSIHHPQSHDEARKKIGECVREIEMIADSFGYDSFEWLADDGKHPSAIHALPDIEAVAAKVHDAWIESKLQHGVTSRKSESGEELIVPYPDLSEAAKELDRATVRAVYAAIEATR